MYDNGRGVAKDARKAAELYEKAATQGHLKAQSNLAISYLNGDGVPKDDIRAYAWFSIAIFGGDEVARRSRGAMEKRLTPAQRVAGDKLAREIAATIRR